MSLSPLAPLARATLASSSRVGLDFGPRAGAALGRRQQPFSSTPVAARKDVKRRGERHAALTVSNDGANPMTSLAAFEGDLPAVRWQPLSPDLYANKAGRATQAPTHCLSVHTSRNNVILTFSDRLGPLFPSISGGTGRTFRGANRSTFEAAHQATLKTMARILPLARAAAAQGNRMTVNLAYKGLLTMSGRDAVHSAIASPEGEELRGLIVRVEDRTPIKIGGTRARNPRRL